MKPVPGICDRCGQRFKLKDLKFEFLLGRSTGLRVCPKCIDPSHPQLDTRNVKTNDKQSVKDSRSDRGELTESRRMFGWNPVGATLTNTMTLSMGRVYADTSGLAANALLLRNSTAVLLRNHTPYLLRLP